MTADGGLTEGVPAVRRSQLSQHSTEEKEEEERKEEEEEVAAAEAWPGMTASFYEG